MTEHDQFQQVQQAASDVVNSSRETSRAVVDSLVTLQDRNLKLAQSLLLSWMELLTPQWGQPTQKQQDPFQRLMSYPMQLYLDFLLAPLTLSRKLVEASMAATQRERERVP